MSFSSALKEKRNVCKVAGIRVFSEYKVATKQSILAAS
jgi:hypothetical protein